MKLDIGILSWRLALLQSQANDPRWRRLIPPDLLRYPKRLFLLRKSGSECTVQYFLAVFERSLACQLKKTVPAACS